MMWIIFGGYIGPLCGAGSISPDRGIEAAGPDKTPATQLTLQGDRQGNTFMELKTK